MAYPRDNYQAPRSSVVQSGGGGGSRVGGLMNFMGNNLFMKRRSVPVYDAEEPHYDQCSLDSSDGDSDSSQDISQNDESDDEDDDEDEDPEDMKAKRFARRMVLDYIKQSRLSRAQLQARGISLQQAVNVNEMQLEAGEFPMANSTRLGVAWALFFIALFSGMSTYVDWDAYTMADQLLQPIRELLALHQSTLVDGIATVVGLMRAFTYIYPVVCLIRLVLHAMMILQDVGDSYEGDGPRNGCWYKVIMLTLVLLICWQFFSLWLMNSKIENMKKDFVTHFDILQTRYARELKVKTKMDNFQLAQKCCGSWSYMSWFEVNLYNYSHGPAGEGGGGSVKKKDYLSTSPSLRNYLWQKLFCHYSDQFDKGNIKFDAEGPSSRKWITIYIQAHGPNFTETNLSGTDVKIQRIKSVPASCCQPAHKKEFCFFYNIHSTDDFYAKLPYEIPKEREMDLTGLAKPWQAPSRETFERMGIHGKSCDDKVKETADKALNPIKDCYMFRLIFGEIVSLIAVMVVDSSFQSYYDLHYRPTSVAIFPYVWTAILIIVYVLFSVLVVKSAKLSRWPSRFWNSLSRV